MKKVYNRKDTNISLFVDLDNKWIKLVLKAINVGPVNLSSTISDLFRFSLFLGSGYFLFESFQSSIILSSAYLEFGSFGFASCAFCVKVMVKF